MARADYTGVPTTEAPPQPADDYQRVQASPNSFGAPVAQGAEALGQGAVEASKFYGQVAADNGTNNTLQQVTNILHGDPSKAVMGPDGQMVPDTGYFGKRGADAMSARGETQQQIDEIIAENRANLSTPEARLQYDVDSRRYRAQWQTEIGTYADAQQRTWATDTNNTSLQIALNAAARNPADPMAAIGANQMARNALTKNAQLNGEDTAGAVMRADQAVAVTRIHALLGNTEDPTAPAAAQKILDQHGDVLSSMPGYDALSRQVKEASVNAEMGPAVTSAVSTFVSQARGQVAVPGSGTASGQAAGDIHSAILGQESGNSATVHPSVNGAIGPGQIKPSTFAEYAKPGEVITNPADNRAVSARILDDYSQRYNGDPGRIATAYFSGPGNVAPAGSPTPYIHDYADGNGKHVSSYVSDVQGRLSGTGSASSGYPSTADALNANMATYLDQARTFAEQKWPNFPDVQEQYVTRVERQINVQVEQQTRQYSVDTHIVQAALAGAHPPTNEQELLAVSPQVATSWRNMQVENPIGASGVERMFDANSRGKADGYGANFKDYLDRALAPTSDPARIKAPTDLYPFVGSGDGAPLTNTGAGALSDLIGQRGTPQGEAFASQVKGVMDQAYGQLSFANRATGLIDHKGDAAYEKFSAQALPILMKANQSGNLASVLNPKSPDYIGNVATTFQRTPAQMVRDRLSDEGVPDVLKGQLGPQFALREAVATNKISRDEGIWIAQKLGYIGASVPPAPAPKPAPHPAQPRSVFTQHTDEHGRVVAELNTQP